MGRAFTRRLTRPGRQNRGPAPGGLEVKFKLRRSSRTWCQPPWPLNTPQSRRGADPPSSLGRDRTSSANFSAQPVPTEVGNPPWRKVCVIVTRAIYCADFPPRAQPTRATRHFPPQTDDARSTPNAATKASNTHRRSPGRTVSCHLGTVAIVANDDSPQKRRGARVKTIKNFQCGGTHYNLRPVFLLFILRS